MSHSLLQGPMSLVDVEPGDLLGVLLTAPVERFESLCAAVDVIQADAPHSIHAPAQLVKSMWRNQVHMEVQVVAASRQAEFFRAREASTFLPLRQPVVQHRLAATATHATDLEKRALQDQLAQLELEAMRAKVNQHLQEAARQQLRIEAAAQLQLEATAAETKHAAEQLRLNEEIKLLSRKAEEADDRCQRITADAALREQRHRDLMQADRHSRGADHTAFHSAFTGHSAFSDFGAFTAPLPQQARAQAQNGSNHSYPSSSQADRMGGEPPQPPTRRGPGPGPRAQPPRRQAMQIATEAELRRQLAQLQQTIAAAPAFAAPSIRAAAPNTAAPIGAAYPDRQNSGNSNPKPTRSARRREAKLAKEARQTSPTGNLTNIRSHGLKVDGETLLTSDEESDQE
jgi:hypothetical protein